MKVRVAGVASVLPTASVARKETVCEPLARSANVFGLPQVVKAALSSLHSSLLVSPAVPWKAKVADLVRIVEPAAGPESIVVSGAVVSTLNVRVAGVASMLPAASIARKETV